MLEGPESPPGLALSGSGQRPAPRAPTWGLGLWVLDGQALGGSSRAPAPMVGGGGPSPAPAALPSSCFPGATRGHSWLPRRAYGAARVAFKISLTNQTWLFQEAPSLAVPLAGRIRRGRDLYIPGSLAKYPLWPEQSGASRSPSPGTGRAWACGRLFGKVASGLALNVRGHPRGQGRTPPIRRGFRARHPRSHDSLFTAIGEALSSVYRQRTRGLERKVLVLRRRGRGRQVSQGPKSLHRRPPASCVWSNLWLPFLPPELFLSRVQCLPEPGAPHPSPNSSLGSMSWLAIPTSE